MMIFSPYLIAAIIAWLVAQGGKYLIDVFKTRSFGNVRKLYLSGHMPSAHSATVVAVLTVIACKDGVGSGLFGLAALFSAVVMYDAVMVRRSSGEQGAALTQVLKQNPENDIALPRVARGHTPLEVLVGALLGAIVGTIVILATK